MSSAYRAYFLRISVLVMLLVEWSNLGLTVALAQIATPTPGSSGFKAVSVSQCPNVGPGDKWRIASKTTRQSDGSIALCIQIVAGDDPIDLSDTIQVDLPPGTNVVNSQAEKGQVTTAKAFSVRWGSFSLNASESSSLLLTISPTDLNSLKSTTITISGRFTRGQQSFKGIIPGLAPLTEVEVSEAGSFKIALPAAGLGYHTAPSDDSLTVWLVVLLVLAGLGLIGSARLRRKSGKRQ